MSCGVKKLRIGCLSPDINNALLIAVVIAKQNYKTFISKKDSEERGVWNFTLRDSEVDTINATIWGSSKFAQFTYEMFNIGDTVEILNPRILFKPPGGTDVAFNPVVSSPFQLHLQENSSDILIYSEDDHESIRELIHIPTKPPMDFLRLSDVYSYGQEMKGEFANLLVAVRKMEEIKTVKSKKYFKDLLCRHITVMDQSHLEFHITLWNEDIIKRSENWRSRHTIVFFADVKLGWDNFRQAITANITSRTVVTENPNTSEAIALKNYAKTAPIHPTAVLDHFANNVTDIGNVSAIMTTAQVLDKAYGTHTTEEQFTALMYVTVTHFNLDGFERVTAYICSTCSQILDDTNRCLNAECLTGPSNDFSPAELSFNLRINLTDHRGTLYNCRLLSPLADKIIGCSAKTYVKMSQDEKTKLKWKLLLTRCEARILVLCTSPERPRPLISLLTCTSAKSKDVVTKLPKPKVVRVKHELFQSAKRDLRTDLGIREKKAQCLTEIKVKHWHKWKQSHFVEASNLFPGKISEQHINSSNVSAMAHSLKETTENLSFTHSGYKIKTQKSNFN